MFPAHQGELPDLGPVPADAPAAALEWRHAAALVGRRQIGPNAVSLRAKGKSALEIRRDPLSILLELIEPPTLYALVHPELTTPMSVLARWRGDLTLHAGSFFADGSAWALIGAREAGKSTMLAELGARGCPLLADDLLVLDGRAVRAGPACVDLRPDVAERSPAARFIGKVGGRPRFRLSTPLGPARAGLAGFFLLDWSEEPAVTVEPVAAGESLRIVYEHEYMGLLGPADPHKVLDLLEVPMWRVSRPRDWSFTPEVVDRVLEVANRGGG